MSCFGLTDMIVHLSISKKAYVEWLDLYVVVSRQTWNINAGDIPTMRLPTRVIVERGRILTSQQSLWREDA